MARIAGVDLPREKRLEYGLTYIYGIGVETSRNICKETGISEDVRVKDLTEDQGLSFGCIFKIIPFVPMNMCEQTIT